MNIAFKWNIFVENKIKTQRTLLEFYTDAYEKVNSLLSSILYVSLQSENRKKFLNEIYKTKSNSNQS